MRRVLAGTFVSALGLIAADATLKNTDLFPWARTLLFITAIVSGLLFIATTEALRPRMPSVGFDRDRMDHSIALRVRPPQVAGTRRLRKETLALVVEMHEHIAAADDYANFAADRRKTIQAVEAAQSEEEKIEIYEKRKEDMTLKSVQESLENQRRFGGGVEYLLDQYERRGLVKDEEREGLIWNLNSPRFMGDTARRLEALAKGL